MERFGEWFVVETGPAAGTLHLAGWRAVVLPGTGSWVRLAECPRCVALVKHEGMSMHDSWHAETDHPVPDEVEGRRTEIIIAHRAELQRLSQSRSRG